ncbi:MAG: ribonuclease R, partial [Rhodospirillales bacterium]
MVKKTKPTKTSRFPSREEILQFIQSRSKLPGKREIARAFKLDTKQKMTLKKVLREMEIAGDIDKGRGKKIRKAGTLPPVTVLEITGPDMDGELMAKPQNWDGKDEPPKIYMTPGKGLGPQPGPGERVLARLTPVEDGAFEASTIRVIAAAPKQVLGIFEASGGQLRVRPTDRRSRGEFVIDRRDTLDAAPGDLVRAEPLAGRRLGLAQARIVEVLHGGEGTAAPSMIAITDYDLPTRFTVEAEQQAAKAGPVPMEIQDGGQRDDIRNIPLVTIDGADARDFDDAVRAEADPDSKNPGGWRLMVAIADVAWYVRPGDALDQCAYERGNSTYFPDRVIPMLPEALSNGWCSLVPGEDRPCMVAHLWISADGELLRHHFKRAIMRSHARLTYEQVQEAQDDEPDETTKPLMKTAIEPLYGAYEALLKNRAGRGVLELDMPERKIVLDTKGGVSEISLRQRLDSHKLIEEFMILANVAAALTLEKMQQPCMYRVHDEPSSEKIEALHTVLEGVGIKFTKGGVMMPKNFNRILKKAAATPHAPMVNEMVLRSQAKAEYGPVNIGHFGLALQRYCHFTSPIRRYADLLVHRALIEGGKLGDGGIGQETRDFAEISEHLLMTERRSASAERDSVDRYTATYLSERVGAQFHGRINGVTRFGLFITLDETGADGLVPVRTLG